MFDSYDGCFMLGSWFLTKQNICSLMASKAFIISPLNLSLVSFSFDYKSSNQVPIRSGLVILNFGEGTIGIGISVGIG
jgi:hypothetical protein